MTATILLTLFVLGEVGWNPINLFKEARAESPEGQGLYSSPACFLEPDRHRVARPRAECSARPACRTS